MEQLPFLARALLRLAISVGARELAASILRKHADELVARAKKTPTKDDDAVAEFAATLMRLAAGIAIGLDLGEIPKALRKK